MSDKTDIGNGLDQPILEKGEFAIFETKDGYMMRQFGGGDVQEIPANASDEFWEELKNNGWEDVSLD